MYFTNEPIRDFKTLVNLHTSRGLIGELLRCICTYSSRVLPNSAAPSLPNFSNLHFRYHTYPSHLENCIFTVLQNTYSNQILLHLYTLPMASINIVFNYKPSVSHYHSDAKPPGPNETNNNNDNTDGGASPDSQNQERRPRTKKGTKITRRRRFFSFLRHFFFFRPPRT